VGGKQSRTAVMVVALAFGATGSVGAQTRARDLMTAARAAIQVMKLDSAARLLRQVLDSAAVRSRAEQVEAWVLLGVVHFYKGNDSVTAADFRQALALDPRLEAPGLARYDSELVALFATERDSARAARRAAAALIPTPVHDCTARCPEGVTPPQLLQDSPIAWPAARSVAPSGASYHVVVRFLVTAAGRVDPASVTLVASSAPGDLQAALADVLRATPFTPGQAFGLPVSVLTQEAFDVGAEIRWVPRERSP
jgi:hypothetical protein